MEVQNENYTEVELNSENFEKIVLNSPKPVIVDFYADWCGPCSRFAPIFEDFGKKYANKIVTGKVNIDKCADLAEKYNVLSIPTVIFIKAGEEVNRNTGFMPADELESAVNRYFGAVE